MRRPILAALFGLVLGTASLPAAAALDPEALRQDLIEGLQKGHFLYSTRGLSFTDVQTRAHDEAVRVEITGLALPLPDLGGRLELGDLAFTVAQAGIGLYRVSQVRTSSQATLIGEAGERAGLVNYRLDRLSGIWSAGLGTFLDLDAAMSGFELVVPEANLGLAIAEITALNQSTTRPDGLTDMVGATRATGLRMLNPAFGTLEIGEIYADYESHGQDLASLQSFTEVLQSLGDQDTPPGREEMAATLERLAGLNVLPGGFIERFRMSDLSYLDAAQRPRFHLDRVELDLAGGDLQGPLGYASLGLKVAGLSTAAPGGEAADPLNALVPTSAGFIASLERFPARLLLQTVLRGMALPALSREQGEAVGEAMGAKMQAAINQAGTVLRLDHLEIETPSGRVAGEGALEVDAAAPAGVTGRLDLTVTGLDQMIALALSAAQGEQAEPQVQGNVAVLMMLKGMARREAAPDGTPIDRLDVLLTPAGEILINGQPFGAPAPPPQ